MLHGAVLHAIGTDHVQKVTSVLNSKSLGSWNLQRLKTSLGAYKSFVPAE